MSHEPATVSCMKNPTKRFSEVIGRVDDTRDMFHDDVTSIFPVLNGKELD